MVDVPPIGTDPNLWLPQGSAENQRFGHQVDRHRLGHVINLVDRADVGRPPAP